jgi:hypothetical protein
MSWFFVVPLQPTSRVGSPTNISSDHNTDHYQTVKVISITISNKHKLPIDSIKTNGYTLITLIYANEVANIVKSGSQVPYFAMAPYRTLNELLLLLNGTRARLLVSWCCIYSFQSTN